MYFHRPKSKRKDDKKGWAVIGMKAAYDVENIREEDWDPWGLDDGVLHASIIAFYKKNPDPDIRIVLEEKNRDDDEEASGDSSDEED